MKRFFALTALVFFATGLNANLTKEDIYRLNPSQFKQLKKELNTLNAKQTEELKKAFQNKQINEAFKAVFLNKDILENSNYAIVKNGKVITSGKAAEAQGITFEHLPADGVAANICVLNMTEWPTTGGGAISDCGYIKYKMNPTSPLASFTEQMGPPQIYLFPDLEISDIQSLFPDEIASLEQTNALNALSINSTSDSVTHPDRETTFESFNPVFDVTPALGFLVVNTQYDTMYLYKTMSPYHQFFDENKISTYYRLTDFVHPNPTITDPIYTLKSGNYLQLLMLSYQAGDYWWEGSYIFFKWFKIKVENYYLGDVGVDNHSLNDSAKITWNNHQITIDLEEDINPSTTTYELYDISGKLIQRKKLNSNHNVFYVPSVSDGVYIVRVKGKNLNLSKKIALTK